MVNLVDLVSKNGKEDSKEDTSSKKDPSMEEDLSMDERA